MTIADTITKGRATAAKAAAGYATAKAGVVAAKRGADYMAHEWRIEDLYAEGAYEAAMKIAAECQATPPGSRRKEVIGDTHRDGNTFTATTWTFLKGIAPGVQARKAPGDVIEFRAFRVKDLEALKAHVHEVQLEMENEPVDIDIDYEHMYFTTIYSWGGDKGWEYVKERVSRSFKSVLIPEALQQEIEADLKRFSESRQRLVRLEMPWRRGFLLEGPPGTGKTSLSLAIAGALRFNLATLSLADVKSDGDLRKAVSTLPGRTVLVIEDIDANAVSHDRDHNSAKDGALSLSGLLNSLDGFETPEGLVTILTTNHIERLDPALVRSGRMDRTFTLDYIEASEVERLFTWFYEQEPPSKAPKYTGSRRLSPADVAELFKQHLDEPEAGWKAVIERIKRPLHVAA